MNSTPSVAPGSAYSGRGRMKRRQMATEPAGECFAGVRCQGDTEKSPNFDLLKYFRRDPMLAVTQEEDGTAGQGREGTLSWGV